MFRNEPDYGVIQSDSFNRLPEELKSCLADLSLSKTQRELVSYYYQLSLKPTLDPAEVSQLGDIWGQAEIDTLLTDALLVVDEVSIEVLEGEALLADDKNLRAHLCEHVPAYAAKKLRQFQGHYMQIDLQKPHVIGLCPDGSGFVQQNIPEEGLSMEAMKDYLCNHCHTKLTKHSLLKLIPGDGRPLAEHRSSS